MANATLSPLVFVDRSRNELDLKCQRARYWGFEYEEIGISPIQKAVELVYGDLIHQGTARISLGQDTSEVIADLDEDLEDHLRDAEELYRQEQLTLLHAHLWGFSTYILPAILATDDICHVEIETTYDYDDGVRLGAKPDALTRRREDGKGTYREYKTSKYVDGRWFKQWPRKVQLVAGCKSAQQTLGFEASSAVIHALYKGYYSQDGGYVCPLVYGWRNLQSIPTTYSGSRPKSWKGWEKFPVWTLPGGVEEWIRELMPKDELAAAFPASPPIMVDELLVENWLAQTAIREREIHGARLRLRDLTDPEEKRRLLNTVFRQNFDACEPPNGRACPYLDACWLPHVEADPIGSRLYEVRRPHHTTDPMCEEER